MKHDALAAITVAAISLSACTTYGSYQEMASISIESPDNNLLVYLVERDQYHHTYSHMAPVQLSEVLADDKSAVVADGQTIRHATGNYIMVWFCGASSATKSVQIMRAQRSSPQHYVLTCPQW